MCKGCHFRHVSSLCEGYICKQTSPTAGTWRIWIVQHLIKKYCIDTRGVNFYFVLSKVNSVDGYSDLQGLRFCCTNYHCRGNVTCSRVVFPVFQQTMGNLFSFLLGRFVSHERAVCTAIFLCTHHTWLSAWKRVDTFISVDVCGFLGSFTSPHFALVLSPILWSSQS